MVVLLKGGKVVNSFVGLVPENSIKEWLNNAIK
jgi:thioredoxin-like negative regulator of GroEL